MVASNYVISAAHCFVHTWKKTRIIYRVLRASEIYVMIGDDDIYKDNEEKPLPTIRRYVSKLDIHNDYVTQVGK